MKRVFLIAAIAAFAPLTQAAIQLGGDITVNQPIPDGSTSGLASVLTINNQAGTVSDLSVHLNISGSWNGDLYAYLTHDNGFSVLLNRPGRSSTEALGYGDAGMNVQFSQGAPNIHTYQQTLGGAPNGPLTGTWSPDGRTVSPMAVNGTETPTALLSSFIGANPNGNWTLFVSDFNGGDLHQLVNWGIDFTPVPETGVWGFTAGLFVLSLAARNWLRQPKSA
jgi:subtilisin-like proprotein convertase family protein